MPLRWSCAFLFLIGNSLYDLRFRAICLWFTALLAGEGLLLCLLSGRPCSSLFPALLPGCLLFGFSLLGSGAIGGGDGIALAVLGCFLDLEAVLLSCLFAFGFCTLPAGFLFLTRHRRQDSLPFLPFLLLGSVAARIFIS